MILGIDLGARWTAVVAARSSAPLHIAAAEVVDVNPGGVALDDLDVEPAVEEIMALVDGSGPRGPEQVAIEHRGWYAARGRDANAQMAIQKRWMVCEKLKTFLLKALYDRGYRLHDYKAIDPRKLPVKAVYVFGRQTWACRVVPHTKGSITDAMAWEGMQPHIAEGAELLEGEQRQDKRDAAGVLLAVLLPRPAKRRAPRVSVPREKPTADEVEIRKAARREREAARVAHSRGRLSAAERASVGCTCRSKHKASCALSKLNRADPLDVALSKAG